MIRDYQNGPAGKSASTISPCIETMFDKIIASDVASSGKYYILSTIGGGIYTSFEYLDFKKARSYHIVKFTPIGIPSLIIY